MIELRKSKRRTNLVECPPVTMGANTGPIPAWFMTYTWHTIDCAARIKHSLTCNVSHLWQVTKCDLWAKTVNCSFWLPQSLCRAETPLPPCPPHMKSITVPVQKWQEQIWHAAMRAKRAACTFFLRLKMKNNTRRIWMKKKKGVKPIIWPF